MCGAVYLVSSAWRTRSEFWASSDGEYQDRNFEFRKPDFNAMEPQSRCKKVEKNEDATLGTRPVQAC